MIKKDKMLPDKMEIFKGVYLRPDESLNLFVSPEIYLKNNDVFDPRLFQLPYSLPQLYLSLIQDEMRRCLDMFVNRTALHLAGKMSGGIVDLYNVREINLSFMFYLARGLLKYINNKELEKFAETLSKDMRKRIVGAEELAYIIAVFYKSMPGLMNILKVDELGLTKTIIKPPPALIVGEQYSEPYYSALKKIQGMFLSRLAPFLMGAYLHGSMATADYAAGCSDIDIMVILKQETVCNKCSLLKLRAALVPVLKAFYRADHLQHHGVQVITELDMKFYCQPYFPFILFNFSKSIYNGSADLTFHERDSLLERANTLWSASYMFRHAKAEHYFPLVSYDWKLYLQVLLLLPALYLQLHNRYSYKKYSYEQLRPFIPDKNWRVMDVAAAARAKNLYIRSFRLTPLYRTAARILPLPWARFLAARLFSRPSAALYTMMGENILEEMWEFAERVIYLSRRMIFTEPAVNTDSIMVNA